MFDESFFKSLVFTSPIACNKTPSVTSAGHWVGDDPLNFLFPVLLLQMIVLFAIARLTHFVLRHLGQPSAISYTIGGILLGPSFLGRLLGNNPDHPHTDAYWKIFGTETTRALNILTHMGDMFFVLVIGVKTDINMLRRSGKKAVAIAIFSCGLPYIFVVEWSTRLGVSYDESLRLYGLNLGLSMSLSSFVVISAVLNEYQMLTSKLGRLAMSTALIGHLASFWVNIFGMAVTFYGKTHSLVLAVSVPASAAAVLLVLKFVVKPVSYWMVKQTAPGTELSKDSFMTLAVVMMVFAVLTEVIGYAYSLGAIVLGIFLPAGPPLGSALVKRLDGFMTGVVIPIHLAQIGLKVDVFSIYLMHISFNVVVFVLLTTVIKFIGVFGPCIYCKLPYRDALLLALMLNCRGITELNAVLALRQKQLIEDEVYTVFALCVVVLGASTGLLLKVMYKPSMRFISYRRRTIQHSKPGDSLRVLAAVHVPDQVPALAALIDASNPSTDSSIHVYVLHLVPLVGHSAAVLAPLWREGLPKPPTSDRIAADFASLEHRHPRLIVTLPYVSMSPHVTMHDDVCSLALDKKATLVLLPFHAHNAAYQTTCVRVFSYAPCSVAVLVDRGGELSYADVGVFFLGGPDDREALSYAARIAEAPGVAVTVVRFRLPADRRGGGRDEVLDDAAVRDFRGRMVENERVAFREEVVSDGPNLVNMVRFLCERLGLVIVGRRKGRQSELTAGLEEWSEFPELGVLGDMLASSDYEGMASALIIQQQARVAGHVSR